MSSFVTTGTRRQTIAPDYNGELPAHRYNTLAADLDEVETLFHEFGHALHGSSPQRELCQTIGHHVSRDFVNSLPRSWSIGHSSGSAKLYATHYQTGKDS